MYAAGPQMGTAVLHAAAASARVGIGVAHAMVKQTASNVWPIRRAATTCSSKTVRLRLQGFALHAITSIALRVRSGAGRVLAQQTGSRVVCTHPARTGNTLLGQTPQAKARASTSQHATTVPT